MKRLLVLGALAALVVVGAPLLLMSSAAVQQQSAGGAALAATLAGPEPTTAACGPAGAVAGEGAQLAAAAAAAAGFTGPDLVIAVAVAGAESSWRADATNDNTNGSRDYGMWQINTVHRAILAAGQWQDPASNARMAKQVWDDAGGSWRPWVTYNTGSYEKHLADAEVAVAGAGGAAPALVACVPAQAVPVSSGPFGAWGGHSNGRIPAGALCSVPGGHQLRCDAAQAFAAMSAAYAAVFGQPISITDSYRDYAGQLACTRAKGSMCAVPGTSNHGWGLALDLGGGINRFGTPQHQWTFTNAPTYGWSLPPWAQRGGSKPEPWHFEFGRPA